MESSPSALKNQTYGFTFHGATFCQMKLIDYEL
ncbi:hypothetical protein N481_10070 [Pseudoalteromonas luteoviolacea S4047-1]|uniref:Uncharacterized protein n=1 Tax=Pseudoalteromonas luteoviolacea S4054 TaxID=1129367 RepID=A0A0F6AB19_9GAMM|nr:hypothetical protein N479_14415 [Pseudoalteromonas luteoviolacea S4054]KZN74050.1 hypothetical protein N481_10070 [Pseudoalteromonas luteoviolacea S4047-1]